MSAAVLLTAVIQTEVRVTEGATTTGIKAGTVEASLVAFLTWSLTCRAGKGAFAFIVCKFLTLGLKVSRMPGGAEE